MPDKTKSLKEIIEERVHHVDTRAVPAAELRVPLPRMKMIKDKILRVPLVGPRMTHPQKVHAILRAIYSDLTDGQEYAHVITLNDRMEMINAWSVGQGGSDHVIVSPKQVFRRILADDAAAAFIIAHNHPSGDPEPSPEDIAMLEDLKRGGTYLDTPLRDFIILGDGTDKLYSHRDRGYEL